uniref:Secreted protein n=1 Tax=Knipowitschia caucasica TaxID=637954 RepID=A0AAV2IS97_KNICA
MKMLVVVRSCCRFSTVMRQLLLMTVRCMRTFERDGLEILRGGGGVEIHRGVVVLRSFEVVVVLNPLMRWWVMRILMWGSVEILRGCEVLNF